MVSSSSRTLSQDDLGKPLRWHPKITTYRFTFLSTTIGFGVAKAFTSSFVWMDSRSVHLFHVGAHLSHTSSVFSKLNVCSWAIRGHASSPPSMVLEAWSCAVRLEFSSICIFEYTSLSLGRTTTCFCATAPSNHWLQGPYHLFCLVFWPC